jgi:hypothetical protein
MEPSPGSAGQPGQRPFGPVAATILATYARLVRIDTEDERGLAATDPPDG